ncbi:MAG: formate dehydrogenase accessory sulfurtransferase FdhD [bacterium]
MATSPGPFSRDASREADITQFDSEHPEGRRLRAAVILERPLTLEVDASSYTLLRTPGADRDLVVGFLFTEGLITSLADILMLRECPDSPDVITVRTADPQANPRRTLIITSSCGLCGREDIDAMVAALGRVESPLQVPVAAVHRIPAAVSTMQPLFHATGGAHSSAFFDAAGNVPFAREDVGRHNALDKLIGYALLRGISLSDGGVFLSGRTSLELIAKAARARIPIVAAVGAPTAAAIDAADRLGITLCGFLREERFSVYTHGRRMVTQV